MTIPDDVRRSLASYSCGFARERAFEAGGRGFVCSPFGVWLLVALLAPTAADPERAIEQVLDMPAEEAARIARELATGEHGDYLAALGVWSNHDLNGDWQALLPTGSVNGAVPATTDVLDAWALQSSRELIDRFPAADDAIRSPFVLASAVSARTTWVEPFEQQTVQWRGREVLGLGRSLYDPDRGGVARIDANEYAFADIAAEDGSRVLLVIGAEDEQPDQVISAGYDILEGFAGTIGLDIELLGVDDLKGDGHSWHVDEQAWSSATTMSTIAFELRSEHDLEEAAGIKELRKLKLPGLFADGDPCQVVKAKQAAMALFHSKGFEAAAVTAIMVAMAAPSAPDQRALHLSFSRPFAFLARDRDDLPWFAGWVVEPAAEPEPEPADSDYWQ